MAPLDTPDCESSRCASTPTGSVAPRLALIYLRVLVLVASTLMLSSTLSGQGLRQPYPGPQPELGPLVSSPPNVVFDTPTTVIFTITIATPTLNPVTVELRQVNADGNVMSIIGRMFDNGQGGDRVPGDRVFTSRMNLNEATIGRQYYQVAAAFRGNRHNALSGVGFVDIDPFALPPDPGEPGKQTLGGIDTDGDGVRDDVQRHIAHMYPQSATMRLALGQYATALGDLLTNAAKPGSSWDKVYFASRCAFGVTPEQSQRIAETRESLDTVTARVLNTEPRSRAYLSAISSSHTLYDDPDDLTEFCTF